jgi:hypothetical protein
MNCAIAPQDDLDARLRQPWGRVPGGYTASGYSQPIWSPWGFLERGDRYVLTCEAGHTADAPLQRLVDIGQGDLPMCCFKWKCGTEGCGSRKISIKVISAARR